LEFDLQKLGKVVSNILDIRTGLSVIKFQNGIVFNNYIHAVNEVGYFGVENIKEELIPELMIPNYNSGKAGAAGNSVAGQGLEKLGYAKGTVTKTANSIRYHQPTWNNNYYEVLVRWQKFAGNKIIGQWTITNNKTAVLPLLNIDLKEPTNWSSHIKWWNDYWNRSSVSLPDALLERQYYLDMYKFGCVARTNTPPISLQAIWTADNGNLPPWKGDLHHDLNTELSYWPGYTANHLNLTASFTNWLWKVKEENKKWTKNYFESDGLNVPGVTTISGKPMGGWIQYSMSPTTAAWMAQHFYWQWKYSMDDKFLKEKCRPYFDEVEKYFLKIREWDSVKHQYFIPLSSSPEYHDNSISAWFKNYTNYDLALIHYLYKKYFEVLYKATGKNSREVFLDGQLFPDFDVNETGLTIAPGQDLDESHRHHAHLMAIYPLGLLSTDDEKQKEIIDRSLNWLEKKGTRQWTGYSFSWAACIYARAKKGDSAVSMLQKFASNFCSVNSFHLNGDQKDGQYSDLKYRPFTLEGNFAFAQGVHELLLQSFNGYIEVFPAIPQSWKDVSFNTLLAQGAFLISAKKENGVIKSLKITAEKGGDLKLKLPFKTWVSKGIGRTLIHVENNIATVKLNKGQTIIFENGYE
jgi:alpha-L-fucosidase 2